MPAAMIASLKYASAAGIAFRARMGGTEDNVGAAVAPLIAAGLEALD